MEGGIPPERSCWCRSSLAEYGYVSQGGGRRYSTAKALEKMGLIRLQVEVHNKWFGGYQPVRAGQYHREWVAYPRKSE